MITERVLTRAILRASFRQPHKTLRLLIDRATDLPITYRMLELAAQHHSGDDDNLSILWSRSGKSGVTDNLAQGAAKSFAAVETLTFLLDQTDVFEFGEGAITGIASYAAEWEELLNLLLSRGVPLAITSNALKAAAHCPHNDDHMLRLLLQQGNDANTTEEVFQGWLSHVLSRI